MTRLLKNLVKLPSRYPLVGAKTVRQEEEIKAQILRKLRKKLK